MGANPEQLRMVTRGYTIPFDCDRAGVPSYHAAGNGTGCTVYDAWLRAAIEDAEAMGAVSVVTECPHIVARVDVIPKAKPGDCRIIVDLRCLNERATQRGFSYETLGAGLWHNKSP